MQNRNLTGKSNWENLKRLDNLENLNWDQWFCKHINDTYHNPLNVYRNAIFAVHKSLILKHPVEYYENFYFKNSITIQKIYRLCKFTKKLSIQKKKIKPKNGSKIKSKK